MKTIKFLNHRFRRLIFSMVFGVAAWAQTKMAGNQGQSGDDSDNANPDCARRRLLIKDGVPMW